MQATASKVHRVGTVRTVPGNVPIEQSAKCPEVKETMDLDAVRALGADLFHQHGISDWTLRFDHAKRRAGSCHAEARTISLSRHLMALYEEPEVRETLLHEIAHALAGPGHGHDAVWRSTALRIGASGQRLVAPDAPRMPAPWLGTCPGGHRHERHRRPARPASCLQCSPGFHPDFIIAWEHADGKKELGPAYTRELRVLQRLTGAPRRRRGLRR